MNVNSGIWVNKRDWSKILQTAQNKAVRVIAGAFCTTLYEPLHQLLSILSMDLRLTMLIQNTALRLHRVSTESQLLRWLGGNWHTQQSQDFPLPTSNSDKAHMTLRALVVRVSSRGPHTNHFPDLPPGSLSWGGRVKWVPKQMDWDYHQTIINIMNLCIEGQTTNIFCNGTFSNRNSKMTNKWALPPRFCTTMGGSGSTENGYSERW